MITPSEYIKNGKYMGADVLFGLSDDSSSRPTSVANGTALIEMDTSKIYLFDAENSQWLKWGAENET